MTPISQEALEQVEREHARGLTSAEILTLLEGFGLKFSEATLRKYVQLGLLPRSVRVGRKGKHTGSQGLYPATIVRQIFAIKDMMAENLTIEETSRSSRRGSPRFSKRCASLSRGSAASRRVGSFRRTSAPPSLWRKISSKSFTSSKSGSLRRPVTLGGPRAPKQYPP